jgi:hypothetical protein
MSNNNDKPDQFVKHEKEYNDFLRESKKQIRDREKALSDLQERYDDEIRKILVETGEMIENFKLVGDRHKIYLKLKREFGDVISKSDIQRLCPPHWK